MAQEITEEMRVLITAEVDKAVREMKKVDSQTSQTEKLFQKLGKTIGSAFAAKEIIKFATESVKAYESQAATLRVLESTVKATGAAAWTSADELAKMAGEFQKMSNYSAGAIESMQSVLLGFKNIKGDNFKEATQAILDMATVMNMDLASAAQSIGKALDDPIKGMDSLKKQGFAFSDSQKKVIKSLLDTGDAAGAQKIVLDELASTFGGAAESGVKSSEQIKNAWEDLAAALGKTVEDSGAGKKITEYISSLADDINKAQDAQEGRLKFMSGMDFYNEWLETLPTERQIQETKQRIEDAENALTMYAKMFKGYKKLQEDMKNAQENLSSLEASKSEADPASKAVKKIDKQIEAAKKKIESLKKQADQYRLNTAGWAGIDIEKQIEQWNKELNLLENAKSEQREIVKAANEEADARSKINDLMYSIETEFEKMSKDDPSVQLEKYNNELKKIASERNELLSADTLGIDKAEIDRAVSQLDYMEKAINKKMLAISVNGKKTWQNWLAGIFSQDLDTFTNGKNAAEKFIKGIESGIEGERQIAATLGMAFDLSGSLETQREKVRSALVEMFSIDPEMINESFKTGDASVDTLLDWYRSAGKQSAEAFQSSFDEGINKSLALSEAMGKTASETDVAAQKMSLLEDRINDVAGAMSEAALAEALKDQNSELSQLIEKYKEFASVTETTSNNLEKNLKALGTSAQDITFDAALNGLQSLGQALGEGKSAEDAWRKGLADMSLEILDALPNLFLRAGLQLIADGMWPLGLGLIAASGVTAITSGAVHGQIDSAKANAKGGVYGDAGYEAFANGGAFTNQIVSQPTFFRFASGGGFRTGLMGEAGPEAIMPLTRGADGSLGISAFGGGELTCALTVNIHSENGTAEATTMTDENGEGVLDIVIKSVDGAVNAGKFDRTFKNRFGLKVRGV